jgi:uncharacterized protein (DUF3084 family)
MDLVAWLMVAVFCVVGAAIAYFADALGRTLGKKRASLWGLRPRHSAAVITTCAGFLIPLVTVGLLWVVSSDVRTIMREGSRAAAERDRKVKELGEVQRLVLEREREAEALGRQRDLARRDLDRTRAELTASSAEVSRLSQEARRLERQAQRLRSSVAQARRSLVAVQAQLGRSRDENIALAATNRLLRAENATLLRDHRAYGRDSIVLRMELEGLKRQVAGAQEEVRQAQADLAQVNARYDEAREAFQQDLERARADLETARLRTDQARGEVERLRLISDNLLQGLDNARTRPMIFALGEEVSRTPLPANLGEEAAANAVAAALRAARAEALNRGAGPMPGDAAALRPLEVAGQRVSVEEQERAAVRALTGKGEQSVVLTYALWNVFAGESAPVRLVVQDNPLVYEQGQLVAETRIDGNLGQNAIVESISRFLQETVAQQAIAARMIPAEGRPERFGTVESEALIRLMGDIQGSGRLVRVQALASEPTRAADPLRLEFRVR